MRIRVVVSVLLLAAGGCGLFHSATPRGTWDATIPVVEASISNPLFVSITDRELVWNQVVDEIDNYFKIRREERVRLMGHVLTEGRIETFPAIGSTVFEPWRRDSTGGFEKLHATLQTVRRRAQVRVIPTAGGYLVDVAVLKELEDLVQPKSASVGETPRRYDTSPERTDEEELDLPQGTLGWIPLGRDISLEQRILANLRGRLMESIPPQRQTTRD